MWDSRIHIRSDPKEIPLSLMLAQSTLESTPITLGDLLLVGSVFTATFIAIWRINTMFAKFNNRLEDLEKDQFGMSQMSELALRQAIANPTMRVPDPRNPKQLIQVFDEDEHPN